MKKSLNNHKIKLEYIWLDGSSPQQIRSKTKIINYHYNSDVLLRSLEPSQKHLTNVKTFISSVIPTWNFDGSSTYQAETSKSELILVPVNAFKNPFEENSILVVSEVWHPDGTPHESNTRRSMVETVESIDDETLYGFEQEYFILDNRTGRPLGWPSGALVFPKPQGDYYCGVGADNVSGRDFVREHTDLCIAAGLEVSGINAEVALGQWEYQIGPVPAIYGSDQLWVSRYILYRLGEKYNYRIELDPKPFKGVQWNGSGMHVNFSTKSLRENLENKKEIAEQMCLKLGQFHKEHIEVYGINNEHRLTGENETSSMEEFGWGIGDRTKSIRIPSSIRDKDSIGYIEDRRPASNADPYLIVDRIIRTILG